MEDTLIHTSTHTKGYRRNHNKARRDEDGLPPDLSHVRIYPYSPGIVALQIRSRDGRLGHVAHANMNREALTQLHQVTGEWLGELTNVEPPTDGEQPTPQRPKPVSLSELMNVYIAVQMAAEGSDGADANSWTTLQDRIHSLIEWERQNG